MVGNVPTVSSVGTFAAIHALDDMEHIEKSYQFNLKAIKMVKDLANENEIETLDTEANFITIKVKDFLLAERLFTKENIRLTTGNFFGYNELIRMSFCIDLDLLQDKLMFIFKTI